MAFIRPSFMDNMSWEMAEVYGAITDQILINLSRYFPYFKAGNVPKSAFEYQANMLAQMGQVNADTIRIIRNGLGGANKALSHCLEQAIIESVKKSQPDLLKAVKAGILKPAGIPIVAPTQMRAFSLYYQQAAQKLNLVNTVMLESTKQAYQATVADIANRVQVVQTALDIGAGETVTGVSTWNQALRHSINRMKENGVVGFIDHGGHRWSAEAYTAMDIRTTVANTARAAVWETNQDFGNDLYIVSYHDGARPLCYDWQNKVISSTNNARTVRDLDGNEIQVYAQSDTTYGEPAGLFGINCKHYPSPFIPGVSVLYDSSEIPSEKENEKIYEQTQQQRALERKLREEKRDLLMAKEMGADADEIKALRAKCRETSDDIDKFCEETGLPRRQNREGVFTQRSFPDKDTYDPALFERQQKEEIDKYFKDGGAQQGYTFGQMDTQTVTKSVASTPISMQPQQGGTLHDSLVDAYEYHRTQNGLTSAPYDPNGKLQFIQSDISALGTDTQKVVTETIGELTRKYDTPLTSVVTMDKNDVFFNRKAFAGVSHNYSNDTARMQINPVKCRNKEKLVARIRELRDMGYCAYVPDSELERYVFTHEFGHSILKITSELDGKNFVGADFTRLRQARDEVVSIFHEYQKRVGELESAKRALERKVILEASQEAADEAKKIIAELGKVRISQYSLTDTNEFFAEAFVYTEYGGTDNEYAMRVRTIIDKYFRR